MIGIVELLLVDQRALGFVTRRVILVVLLVESAVLQRDRRQLALYRQPENARFVLTIMMTSRFSWCERSVMSSSGLPLTRIKSA